MEDEENVEFDNAVQGESMDGLIGRIRECARAEVREEIEALEQENAELRRYRDMADEMKTYKKKVQQMRIEELVRPFEQPAWIVDGHLRYVREKCDLCDVNRERHFTSPLGRTMQEKCTCAEQKWVYEVAEVAVMGMSFNDEFHQRWCKINRKSRFNDFELLSVLPYAGEPFSKELDNRGVLFLEKDKAEEFAKWLNEREHK